VTGSAALASATAEGAQVGVVALDLSGPQPRATLKVGAAEPVQVIFDTGASGNIIDVELARSIGLPNLGPAMVGSPAGGPNVEGFQTRIAAAQLGGVELRAASAVALPFQAPAARGVFGANSFAGKLVTLDFGRSQIQVSDKSVETIPAGTAFPYSEGPRGLPAAEVEVGGRRFEAHIDTGSNGELTFPAEFAGQLPLDGPLRPVGRARLANGAERVLMGARIQGQVKVGPVLLENPRAVFMEGLPRVNIGMGVLRGLKVVLDPAERRSWLLQ
jgi:predicted aspartyl protease